MLKRKIGAGVERNGIMVCVEKWKSHKKPVLAVHEGNYVYKVSSFNNEETAEWFVEKMSEFFASIGMPAKLSDFGINKESVDRLTALCTFNYTRTIKNYVPMGEKEIKEIFNSCF